MGVCSLVRARWPSLTPAEVIDHVIATGDAIPFDHPIGPRVNAFRAVTEIPVAAVGARAMGPAPGVSPNPFTSRLAITFTLERAGPASLAVLDLAGRNVHQTAPAWHAAGVHRWTWDVTDREGRRAPPGVYWIRVRTADGTSHRRVVRIH